MSSWKCGLVKVAKIASGLVLAGALGICHAESATDMTVAEAAFVQTLKTEAASIVKEFAPETRLSPWEETRTKCVQSRDELTNGYVKAGMPRSMAEEFSKAMLKRGAVRVIDDKNPELCAIAGGQDVNVGTILNGAGELVWEMSLTRNGAESFARGTVERMMAAGITPEEGARFLAMHESSHGRTMKSMAGLLAEMTAGYKDGGAPKAVESLNEWFEKNPESQRLHTDFQKDLTSQIKKGMSPDKALMSLFSSTEYGKFSATEEALADVSAVAGGEIKGWWGRDMAEKIAKWRELEDSAIKSNTHLYDTWHALRIYSNENLSATDSVRQENLRAHACAGGVSLFSSVEKTCGERSALVGNMDGPEGMKARLKKKMDLAEKEEMAAGLSHAAKQKH